MAATAWICRKTDNGPVVDGVVYAVVNADSADPEATVLAEALATAAANGIALYPGYFNSADQFLAVGQFDADEDGVFFGDRVGYEVIA